MDIDLFVARCIMCHVYARVYIVIGFDDASCRASAVFKVAIADSRSITGYYCLCYR